MQTRVCIILGGTNDLGHRQSGVDIAANVVKLHEFVHRFHPTPSITTSGMQTYSIAVTLPQLKWPIIQKERLRANALLRDYSKKCSKRVVLVDLENSWDQNIPENAIYWSSDFVHLSKKGYEDFARLIYSAMDAFEIRNTDVHACDDQ